MIFTIRHAPNHSLYQVFCIVSLCLDYHKDCIKECFEKTGELRCPKCRQAPSDPPSLTSKVVVSLTSQDGFSMASQESRCSAQVTIAVEPD